jgi:hypothetical protein
MYILVTTHTRQPSENYDKVFYLKNVEKQLEENESIIGYNDTIVVGRFSISRKGVFENYNYKLSHKTNIEENYKKDLNQVCLRPDYSKSNINIDGINGEIIYMIGNDNHLELEV